MSTLKSGYQGLFNPAQVVTIANGAQSSSYIAALGFVLCGFYTPAALTGTAMTFEVCDTPDGTFLPLKSTTSGTALSYTVAASGYYAVDPKDFMGVSYLKIKSGSAEGAARTIKLSLKGL